jgi:acyl phosphate:glycerol-3-phosphate acyltransferase
MRPRGGLLAAVALGYLAGTVPSADLAMRAARGAGADLRREGSGNPGAANAAAVLGKKWGLAVMVADIVKGAAASAAGRRLAGGPGANLAGSAAVIGHCYPVWNGFRGGKGVAASVGQVLVTFPAHLPVDVSLAVGTAAVPGVRRRAFAATAVASAGWVAMAVLWWRRRLPNLWGPPPDATLPVSAAISSVVIAGRFLTARAPQPEASAPGEGSPSA